MNKIIFPLTRGMTGAAVADLHTALQALLDRALIQPNDQGARIELSIALVRDRVERSYGSATRRGVGLFQEERELEARGEVDERTSSALNALLGQLGLLDGTTDHSNQLQRVVSGRVSRSDQQPFKGTVRALHVAERATIRLGDDETDAEGNYTIRYESLADVSVFNLRVSVLDEAGTTVQSSDVVRDAKAVELLDLVVPFVKPPVTTRQIEGRVVFDNGAPAEGLRLRLYRLGFGGAEGESRLTETTAREHGVYSLSYTVDGQTANLEVRAVDPAGKEVALSKIIKNAGDREVLNLVAPVESLPMTAEFVRLASDLQPHVGDLGRLRTARETTNQQDLTILHEATGWDARLIATAAMATKLSVDEETGLPQDALYGLLRVGLPSDKLQLARVTTEAFDQALNKARVAGIVDLNNEQVSLAKQSFETFSVNTRLAVQAPGSQATYGQLLNQLNLGEAQQQTFAKLYLNHRGDAKSLWKEATDAGLEAVVPRLQRQGKLAFLTTNNPNLMATLENDLGDAGPEQLVNLGLYKKENWLARIDVVPSAFAHTDNPKESYAEDMARRVRISYSTEVTFNMIETGELKIEGGNANLSAFLKNAIGKGFKLGQTPIDAFIKANPDVFEGIEAAVRGTTTEMLKSLQRVYQITPGNDAMKALLNAGLLSAQDVLAYPLDLFLERFGDLFPSEEQAKLVYRKAEQVSNITYSLFSLAKELDSSPPILAMSASPDARRDAKT
ncbi:MAG TPA: hypothetical protein VFP64_00435, partial [Pyrinomonadaceae bacterium]|nr:hypothetical protein [Pyrinomonadaceae bacterium]